MTAPLTPSAEATSAAEDTAYDYLDSGAGAVNVRDMVEYILTAALPHLRRQIVGECAAALDADAVRRERDGHFGPATPEPGDFLRALLDAPTKEGAMG